MHKHMPFAIYAFGLRFVQQYCHLTAWANKSIRFYTFGTTLPQIRKRTLMFVYVWSNPSASSDERYTFRLRFYYV